MDPVWTYDGRAYPLDLLDADTLRRFDRCVADYLAAADAGPADPAAGIAGLCGRLRVFFDALLGAGAGEALLGAADSLRAASACYLDFMGYAQGQLAHAREVADLLAGRYSPGRALREADHHGA